MVEVVMRAAARVSLTVAFVACTAVLVLGFVALAGARPDGGGGRGVAGGDEVGGYYGAASEEYELGTRLVVTLEGVSVVVSVDGAGPVEKGVDLDLSADAAEEIGLPAGGTAVVDVMVANPEAPLGPLSTSGGSSVSSSTVTTGTQVNGESSQTTRVRLVVDGVEIADSEVVGMVASSTGRVEAGAGGEQYDRGEGEQYQYRQYQYDDPQYGGGDRGRPEGYEYDAYQYAGRDDPGTFRADSDEEAAAAAASVDDEQDGSGASDRTAGDVERETDKASTRTVEGDPADDNGEEGRSRRSGAALGRLEQLPATGGPPLAVVLGAGLFSAGFGALLVRKRLS